MRSIPSAPAPLLLPDGRPAIAAWSLDPAIRHLNHGSFGAVPRVAQAMQRELITTMEADPVGWFVGVGSRVAAARAEIAAFLGVDPEVTALVPNASAGASAVYQSIDAPRGADIVVTNHGYGAVTMGAERAARRWGGRVVVAPVPLDATADAAHDAILAACTERTRLIVIDQVTSPTARFLPIGAVAASARARGILTAVDGAHAPGLVAEPLSGAEPDFWFGNLHKFACAPRGTAALVVRREHHASMYPIIDSWGSLTEFPARFDIQGTQDLTSYLAAPTAFRFIDETWGWPAARDYLTTLADYAEALIAAAIEARTGESATVDVGQPVNGLRLVRVPGALLNDVAGADAMRERVHRELGVATAFSAFDGQAYFRLSSHVYSTAADAEDFVERVIPKLFEWAG